jgi:hypothetical protein
MSQPRSTGQRGQSVRPRLTGRSPGVDEQAPQERDRCLVGAIARDAGAYGGPSVERHQ